MNLMSCCCIANVKQVLTVVFAVFIFDLNITALNALGILVTLAGGAWYAYVEYFEKAQNVRTRPSSAGRTGTVP